MLIYSKQVSSLARSDSRGFTLVELLVVISIAVAITTALVIQQSRWNDRLVVNTQAYELAMMIRQAQIYSLGVKEYSPKTGDKFDIGYGIFFDTNNARYIFFADTDKDQEYDLGEEVETVTFTRGVTISDVCGSSWCFFTGGGSLRQADISFFRPDTKANIRLMNVGGGTDVDSPPVTIYLKSPNGKISSVKVESNGQVYVTQ